MAFLKDCPMKMKIWFLRVVDSASSLIHITNFVHQISFQAFKVTDELGKINIKCTLSCKTIHILIKTYMGKTSHRLNNIVFKIPNTT